MGRGSGFNFMAHIIHDFLCYNIIMGQNVSDLLERSLDGSRLELLHLLAYQASMLRMPLHLVGGVVRDVLMHDTPPFCFKNELYLYLALAAQLLAGLDGIQRRIDPTEAGYGPIDDDIFSWPADRRATIQRLPASLEEALMALKADHAFLLAGGVFSEDLIAKWIDHKMKAEVLQVMNRPHPYEMTLYF